MPLPTWTKASSSVSLADGLGTADRCTGSVCCILFNPCLLFCKWGKEHRSGPVTPKCLSLWGTRVYFNIRSRWEAAKHSFWAQSQVLGLSSLEFIHISARTHARVYTHTHIHPTLSLPAELKLLNLTNIKQSSAEENNTPDKEVEWDPRSCPIPLRCSACMDPSGRQKQCPLSLLMDWLGEGSLGGEHAGTTPQPIY